MFLLVLMRLTSILLLKVPQKAGYQNHSLRQSVRLGVAQKRVFKIGRATDLVLAFLPSKKRFMTNTTYRAALSVIPW